MYTINKKYIETDLRVSELVQENPSFLLVLEHFGIDDVLRDKSIADLCSEYAINESLFVAVCNLYNDFSIAGQVSLKRSDLPVIIMFLRNSHKYYRSEKYPEILSNIKNLCITGHEKELKLVEDFFNEYFIEVSEHLEYEENIVFPYFTRLAQNLKKEPGERFSAAHYLNHHTDIESKLGDLKNLLLNHLHFKNLNSAKRKLLYALFELEFDLKVHSMIEEQILIPLGISLEKEKP